MSPDKPMPPAARSALLERFPWWVLLPIACQAAFGWIGFSPTDEGWLQAVARRLLDGDVPHRDFVFLRPALSAYLQVPLVWLGGDHLLWWARLWGWCELAGIAWLWSGLVGLRGAPRAYGYIIGTLLSAHTFPVMAWHTLDALLLCSIAVRLARHGAWRRAFFCVGCAALCRQNFALFAPILLLSVGGPVRFWFAAGFWSALPALLYLAALVPAGAADDFIQQIRASGGVFADAAFVKPVQQPLLWAGLALGALTAWLARQRPAIGPALWFGLLLVLGAQLVAGPSFIKAGSFQLFGATLAWCALRRDRALGLPALGLAWATLISLGYDNPVLAAAPLALVLWLNVGAGFESHRRALLVGLAATLAIVAASTWARLRYPYCDAPAWELAWNAGDALPGANGLRTNARTIANLAELRELALDREARGVPYVVLTDFSAHWIRSAQRNPLLVEWPLRNELGAPGPITSRVLDAVDRLPSETEIFVQKFLVPGYGWGLLPLSEKWPFYPVLNHVRATWVKRAETRFFDIYVKPASTAPPAPAVR